MFDCITQLHSIVHIMYVWEVYTYMYRKKAEEEEEEQRKSSCHWRKGVIAKKLDPFHDWLTTFAAPYILTFLPSFPIFLLFLSFDLFWIMHPTTSHQTCFGIRKLLSSSWVILKVYLLSTGFGNWSEFLTTFRFNLF